MGNLINPHRFGFSGTTDLTIDDIDFETVQSTATTRTLSFTVGAASTEKKILIVGLTGGGSTLTVTSCTYAGQTMTSLASNGTGAPYYSETRLFYLLDPPTGTADVVATQSTGTNMSIRFVLSVYGVKQDVPVVTSGQRFSTPNTLTLSITATVANSWLISSIYGSNPANATSPSNYFDATELGYLDNSVSNYYYNGLDKSPAIGSASAPSFNYKHPANSNAQPVAMWAIILVPYA